MDIKFKDMKPIYDKRYRIKHREERKKIIIKKINLFLKIDKRIGTEKMIKN